MPTNPFFQWYNDKAEQSLADDLITESIQNMGHDVYYLPRTSIGTDEILNETIVNKFQSACLVEVYVKNFDSFEGEGQLMAKFGLEIRDQMTLVMSNQAFEQWIRPTTGKERPYEGDCIYIPMLKAVYQIKFVNNSAVFYTLGKLNMYDIVCELLEYSNEQFETGVSEIDSKYPAFDNAITDANTYNLESYDVDADNATITISADEVLNFDELDPYDVGEF